MAMPAKAGLDTRGNNLMFGQLSCLRLRQAHRPLLGVFEQVPNFARLLEQERLMRVFVEQLSAAGYVAHHQVLEARHYGACQHRERTLAIVAVRSSIRPASVLGRVLLPLAGDRRQAHAQPALPSALSLTYEWLGGRECLLRTDLTYHEALHGK